MSKIGRKSIALEGVQVDVIGRGIHYKGKKASGVFEVPALLDVEVQDGAIRLLPTSNPDVSMREKRDLNRVWGLNHALLKNMIDGARQNFEVRLQINGLGFKAVLVGTNKIVFSLGYSHKIDFPLPTNVSAEVDAKTGQQLTLKSSDKVKLGEIASRIRALRKPEVYKGTGIKRADEKLLRKPGKAKSS